MHTSNPPTRPGKLERAAKAATSFIAPWIPVLAVPLVLFLADVLNDLILKDAARVRDGASTAFAFRFIKGILPFEEFMARVEWASAALAFFVAGLASVGVAIYVGFANLRWAWIHQAVLAIGAAFLLHKFSPTFEHFVLHEPLLKQTVYHISPQTERIGGWIDLLAAVVIALVTIAACSAVASVPANPKADAQDRITRAIGGVRNVRLLLAAAAITMVVGVFQVGSLYNWSGSMVVPDAQPAEQQAAAPAPASAADPEVQPYLTDTKLVAQSASLAAGVVYTSLLAAIFLPAFGVLRSRARSLAEAECPAETEEARTKWLTERGLVATLPKQAVSAIAVLAPLLVGGPGSLLLKVLGGE